MLNVVQTQRRQDSFPTRVVLPIFQVYFLGERHHFRSRWDLLLGERQPHWDLFLGERRGIHRVDLTHPLVDQWVSLRVFDLECHPEAILLQLSQ